ncbi:GAF and ANTAR domain-containing protein [Phytoactinopolyspora alkaliphila]|uniref:GAF and ANTAR domain-containing protein n=1 Tax=Phytoactinopolyspora alkaliphila TaxID=1783498 RepID=A0A6N9YJ07_9ACTN|nr:GAF and ANTAR domain-containing protein [Phytoactinopolyspora alkaliphila]NED94942.1 GAF and ANTAR domain-containing protein [Phytoactinopolyspora alkaliphila]
MGDLRPVEFAELAVDLRGDFDLANTVRSIPEHASAYTNCDQASVVVGEHRPVKVASATNSQARHADQLQVELEEGPGAAAMASGQAVVVDDISAGDRWQRWTSQAAELGFTGVISVRLSTKVATIGALNLYVTRPAEFDDDDIRAAEVFARHAALAVDSAHRISTLRRAVDDRTIIGQALGILSQRHGLDATRAYAMLERYAKDEHVGLRDGAEEVIAGRLPAQR